VVIKASFLVISEAQLSLLTTYLRNAEAEMTTVAYMYIGTWEHTFLFATCCISDVSMDNFVKFSKIRIHEIY
jgi:hypothetical protein